MSTYQFKRDSIIRSKRFILVDNLVCQDGRILLPNNTFIDYFEYLRIKRSSNN